MVKAYTIHFSHPELSGPLDPTETVQACDLVARINELSGRAIGRYIVDKPIRRNGRAFVAGGRDGVSFWVRAGR